MTTRVTRVFFVLLAAWLLLAGPALAQLTTTKEVYNKMSVLINVDYAGGICFMTPDTFINNGRFIPKIVHLSATGILTTAVTAQDVSSLGQSYDFYVGSSYSNARSIACNENGTVWAMIADKRYQIGTSPYGALFQKAPNQPKDFMFDAFKPVSMSAGQTGYAAGLDSIYAGFGRMEMWARLTDSPTNRTANGYVGRLTGFNQISTIFTTRTESLGDLYYHFVLTKNATWIPVRVTASNYWKLYRFSLIGDRALVLEGFTPASEPILGIASNSNSIILQNLNKGEVEYVQLSEAGGAPQVFRGLPAAEFQALTESGVHYILTADKKLYRRLPGQTRVEEIPLTFKPIVIVASKDRVYLSEYTVGGVDGKIHLLDEQTKPILTITANLPEVQAGQSYSRQLAVAGGTPPYSWSLVSGSLPSGLTLSRQGLISGLTYAPGTYAFTVEASDSAGNKAQTQTTVVVKQAILPEFSAESIVNGASFKPGISPGSIVTIFGRHLNPAGTLAANETDPMATELNGVEVLLNGSPAPLFHVIGDGTNDQITIQLPFETSEDKTKIQIRARTEAGEFFSKAVEVPVQKYAPAVFQFSTENGDFGIFTNVNYQIAGKDNVPRIQRGEVGVAWATGLGNTSPTSLKAGKGAPKQAALSAIPRLTFSGVEAEILYTGAVEGFVGLYQINFIMPDVPEDAVRQGTISMGGYESTFNYL